MSKKRPQKPARLGAAQTQQGASAILHEAFVYIRQGNYDRAIARLGHALERKSDPTEIETARRLRAEAYLRGALAHTNRDLRLRMIDAALGDTPGAPRLRFYRGLTLWEMELHSEALVEWDAVAADRPDWPSLAFLRALAHVALKKSWQATNLSPAEIRTLRFLQAIVKGQDAYAMEMAAAGEMVGEIPAVWQGLAAMLKTGITPDQHLLSTAPGADVTVAAIVNYYRGVAAQRAGDTDTARDAWMQAGKTGWHPAWLIDNLGARQRQNVNALAEMGKCQEIVALAGTAPGLASGDRIFAETVALAYNHLGHVAALAGDWAKAARLWTQASQLAGSRQLAQNLALANEAQEDWDAAAEAWRDMVRRRPRKTDHPDYLSDGQVAGLWHHAAICYQRAENAAEAVACLKNASKYAGDDIDIRLALAGALLDNDQQQAAINEIDRILDIDKDNIEALVLRGHSMEPGWDQEQIKVWKRVLTLQPDHAEAKEALAQAYLSYPPAKYLYDPDDKTAFFEEALTTLPNQPDLLLALGHALKENGQNVAAIAAFRDAYLSQPDSHIVAGNSLHQLLQLGADAEIEALLPRINQALELLLPAFWIDQAHLALKRHVGARWIERFIDEAIALTARPYVNETPAYVLARACEIFIAMNETSHLATCLARMRSEVPQSGAIEYIEAKLAFAQGDTRASKRLLATGRRLARLARETKLLDLMDNDRMSIGGRLPGGLPPLSPSLLRILMDVFPDGPPDPDDLDEFLNEAFNR